MADKIEARPVKITETILRDAHQSLIATRMSTEEMLPIIDRMDQVGYHAVKCWGKNVSTLTKQSDCNIFLSYQQTGGQETENIFTFRLEHENVSYKTNSRFD